MAFKFSNIFGNNAEEFDDEMDDVESTDTAKTPVPFRRPSTMEITMTHPVAIADAEKVCDALLSGVCVIINFENTDTGESQRIIDYVSGCCYGLNGNLQKVSSKIFIVAPYGISLGGEFYVSNYSNNDNDPGKLH